MIIWDTIYFIWHILYMYIYTIMKVSVFNEPCPVRCPVPCGSLDLQYEHQATDMRRTAELFNWLRLQIAMTTVTYTLCKDNEIQLECTIIGFVIEDMGHKAQNQDCPG